MALIDARIQIANILRNNETLQNLYTEFGVDFEDTQNELVKDILISEDATIQANTVFNLAENPNSDLNIEAINEEISTLFGFYPGLIGAPHADYYANYKSSAGTNYTYFLKWIYYTYKYYNEEQFFFNNMLEKFVPRYDSEVISSTTNLKIYFDGLGVILDTLDQKIEDLYTLGDIDSIDESHLQYLAHLVGYHKEDFSIKNISFRELIKNLIEIYQTKGTEYSYELFFKLLGFDAIVTEYYWDRDAQNPEGFPDISSNNFLYYLTRQDPRTRTVEQILNLATANPIQPIRYADLVDPKDLRDFESMQSDYSTNELLGFVDSDISLGDRFTYFKTNYIQFKLVQYYTKTDLTAKDTNTILKYIRFLTPIYISSFIEVAATPFEDWFVMENPESGSVSTDSHPGTPAWVDILSPFLHVLLKEYIPLFLSPPSELDVVIAQYPWTDNNSDAYPDSALNTIFGYPAIGAEITGTIDLSSSKDLSSDNYIALKIDLGRGTKITISGASALTYSTLKNELISKLSGIATVVEIPSGANFDLKISSLIGGTTSKIFLADGLQDPLFYSLSTTLENPIDGFSPSSKGYQCLGLDYANSSDPTGLSAATSYIFYINVDINGFIEVDASGPIPTTTSASDIVNAINNHYESDISFNFVTSGIPEYVSSSVTSDGKIFIAYNNPSTLRGEVIFINVDGSVFKSGIIFTNNECTSVSVASVINERNVVIYYDPTGGNAKYEVYDNNGVSKGAGVLFGSSITSSTAVSVTDNDIAIAYNKGSAIEVVVFNLITKVVGSSKNWTETASNITIELSGDKVITGWTASNGGHILYLSLSGTILSWAFESQLLSTKTFTSNNPIDNISLNKVATDNVLINWIYNETGYTAVYNTTGSSSATNSFTTGIDLLETSKAYNGNIMLLYSKISDGAAYSQVVSITGTVQKNEELVYNDKLFNEVTAINTTSGLIAIIFSTIVAGHFKILEPLKSIASITEDSYLRINSLEAGDTWDDTLENYSDTTDHAHLVNIGGSRYEYDKFAEFNRNLSPNGVDFTAERNSYNTFYSSSPNDDLIPIIEDALVLIYNYFLTHNESPIDKVERAGFYIQRNGYISRNGSLDVSTNNYKRYYTRHQDFSEDLRTDADNRVTRELDWPQWEKANTTNDNWSSWTLALDYFRPSINYTAAAAAGGIVMAGAADTIDAYVAPPSASLYGDDYHDDEYYGGVLK